MRQLTMRKLLAVALAFAGAVLPGTEAKAVNYALCTGLNKYNTSYVPSSSFLSGSVPDARNVYTNITLRGEWEKANSTIFTNAQATFAAVSNKLMSLASAAVSGDVVLYYHSSHGYQDRGKNTGICMYDDDMPDSSFAKILANFKAGVKVIIVLDTCHSGGMFKSLRRDGSARALDTGSPFAFAQRVNEELAAIRADETARGIRTAPKLAILDCGWITAADYNQYSWDGDEGGAFTGCFVGSVKSGACDKSPYGNGDAYATFKEMFDYAVAQDETHGDNRPGSEDYTMPQCTNTTLLAAVTFGWVGKEEPSGIRFAPIPQQTVTVGQSLSYTLVASNADGSTGTIVYSVASSTAPAGSYSLSGSTFAFTPPAAGSYTFGFLATNKTAQTSARATMRVDASLAAPTGLAAGGITATSFTAVWDAVPGAASYELDVVRGTASNPAAGALGGDHVKGFPKNVGNVTRHDVTGLQPLTGYAFALRAIAGGEASGWSDPVSVTTTNDPAPPAWSAIPAQTAAVGHEFSIDLAAYVAGWPTPTLSLSAGDAALSGTVLSFTPATVGEYAFVVNAHNGSGEAEATFTVTAAVHVSTKYAVCVGINEYDMLSSLFGCVNDSIYMEENLIERGGWAAENVVRLNDKAATKAAIRAAIRTVAGKALPGDTFVYLHSSHGGQFNATEDDEDPLTGEEGKATFLCVYDEDYYDNTTAYNDHEIAADLQAFPAGVKVAVIVDACHSGGLFKSKKAARAAAKSFDLAGRVTAIMEAGRVQRKARGENVAKSLSPAEIGWATAAEYYEYSYDGGFYHTDEWLTNNVYGDEYYNQSAHAYNYPSSYKVGGVFMASATWGWWNGDADADGDGLVDVHEFWQKGYDFCSTVGEFWYDDAYYNYYPQCTNSSVLRSVVLGRGGEEPPLARPANDDYSAAENLGDTAEGPVSGSNEGATWEAGEPAIHGGVCRTNSVWWTWTAPATGVACFDTLGSEFDTVLAVFTNATPASIATLKAVKSDGGSAGNGASRVWFNTAAERQYWIAVAGSGAQDSGQIALNWQQCVKVAFRGNGATSGSMGTLTNAYKTATALPTCGFERPGYSCDGWATSATGTVAYALDASPAFTKNTTLYAHWVETPKPNLQGYTPEGWPSSAFLAAEADGTNALESVRAGGMAYLRFCYGNFGNAEAGRYRVAAVASNAAGQVIAAGIWTNGGLVVNGSLAGILEIPVAEAGAYAAVVTLDPDGAIDEKDESDNELRLAFTAVLPARQTVTFDANGGTCGTERRTYTVGGTYGDLPAAQREGYAWLGWFTAAEGGEPVTGESGVTAEDERTLWAQWRAETYAVGLDAQGGSGGTEEVAATYGEVLPEIAVPVREGFRFMGYFAESGGRGELYYTADGTGARAWTLAGNATLFAAWAELPRLELDADGRTFGQAAATGQVLKVAANVEWTAESDASWLTVLWCEAMRPTSGLGEGRVAYNVEANSGTNSRTGTITVAGGGIERTFTVTQEGLTRQVTTFKGNGGTPEKQKTTNTVGKTYGTLPVVKRSGYAPAGWFTKTSGGTQVTADSEVTAAAKRTLYAHWTTKQVTTFKGNGGSPSSQKTTNTVAETYGTLPKATWKNHVFLGWFTKAEGGSQVTADSKVSAAAKRTLYAHWTDQQVTTFKGNGGAPATQKRTNTMAKAYGPLPEVAWENHACLGWHTAKTGGERVTADSKVTVAAKRTLYAQWTTKQVTTFKGNGGTPSSRKTTNTIGKVYKTLPTPTWKNHVFLGWSTDKTGGKTVTEDSKVTEEAKRTLYAQWTDKQVTTFKGNGGTPSSQKRTNTIAKTYGPLPEATWSNHVCLGWFTSKTGGTQVMADSKVTVAAKRTLYAHWTDQQVTTFKGNGGTPSTQKTTNTMGTAYGKLPKAKWTNHVFLGWGTKPEGGKLVTKDSKVTVAAKRTLYAQWTVSDGKSRSSGILVEQEG